MDGRTGGARSRAARRRGRLVALGLSVLVHVLLLGWFALRRDAAGPGAEAPVMIVELVQKRLEPRQAPSAPPTPPAGRPSTTPLETPVAPRMAPVQIDPGSGAARPGGVDLNGPVFADGRWPRPEPALRSRCDPAEDPARLSPACRREDDIARAVTAANDPQYGKGEFAGEARRKEAIRRYRNGTGETPTMPCMVFDLC